MKERLPEGECVYLGTLSGAPLRARARSLYESGWSLAAIAEAFNPPKQRSSVRAWVLSNSPVPAPHTQPPLPPSPTSPSSSNKTIAAAEKLNPALLPPSAAELVSRQRKDRRNRRVFDPTKPRISPAQKNKIARLAPLARRYRAKTSPNGTYARANVELTDLCKNLYYSGASVRELSNAASVTYRAMARRLGR
jgi:hypothetical protein